jgi:predicted methyltransferase
MELASMLAGEPFTDHPASVCPVIGSFLRAYNDAIDDRRRQDLYAYASMVVGTRTSVDLQRKRAHYLTIWENHFRRNGWVRLLVPARLRKLAHHRHPSLESVGTHAVHAISRHDNVTHQAVLEAIDHLLALGSEQPPVPAFAPDRRARPRVDAAA